MRGFTSTLTRSAALALTGLVAIGLSGCMYEKPADTGGDEVVVEEDAVACAECAKGEAGEAVYCVECKKGYIDGEMATACATCFAAKQGGPACPT